MSPNDEIERLSRSLKSLEPIRLHEEISRVTELSRLASTRIAEVMRVNQQHWQHMIDQTTAVSRMTDLPYIHRTWLRNLKSTQDQAAQLQIALKSTLGPIAARLAVSERLFTGVDVAAICRSIALPELEILRLQDSINDMTAIYGKMAESICTYPDITHLPRFVLPGATREVFVTGYAANALGVSDESDAEQDSAEIQPVVDEVEEEISICASLLKDVDPALWQDRTQGHGMPCKGQVTTGNGTSCLLCGSYGITCCEKLLLKNRFWNGFQRTTRSCYIEGIRLGKPVSFTSVET